MYEVLDRMRLSSGGVMEIGVVTTPDDAWRDAILNLLSYAQGAVRWHLRQSLSRPLDRLQTRCYLGVIEGCPIAHIMIIGSGDAAILAHVFTDVAYRQRGVSRALMACQMAHTMQIGPPVLTLGADPQGHAARMYASFGFRPISSDGSFMLWERTSGAAAALVGRPLGAVRPLRWDDYGILNLLALQPVAPDEELPRSPALHVKETWDIEGSFVAMQARMAWGRWSPPVTWLVLASADGDIAQGWALLSADERWFHNHWALDLFVRPGSDAAEGYRRLLAALPRPPGRVICPTAGDSPRAAALHAAGFRVSITLPAWLATERAARGGPVHSRLNNVYYVT